MLIESLHDTLSKAENVTLGNEKSIVFKNKLGVFSTVRVQVPHGTQTAKLSYK